MVVDGRNGRIRRRKVFGCLGVVASLNDVSTDGADEWAGPVPLQH